MDFSTIGLAMDDDTKLNYTASELAANIYFNGIGDGRGFYGSLSYQNIAAVKQTDYTAEDGKKYEGTATSKIIYGGLNAKIGVNVGRFLL